MTNIDSSDSIQLIRACGRHRFGHRLKHHSKGLIKDLRKAKKEALPDEKPTTVETRVRDMIVVPEMIGSVMGTYKVEGVLK